MRRPSVLLALLGVVALLVRRRRAAARDDGDLWGAATSVPDLR